MFRSRSSRVASAVLALSAVALISARPVDAAPAVTTAATTSTVQLDKHVTLIGTFVTTQANGSQQLHARFVCAAVATGGLLATSTAITECRMSTGSNDPTGSLSGPADVQTGKDTLPVEPTMLCMAATTTWSDSSTTSNSRCVTGKVLPNGGIVGVDAG